MRRNGSGNPFSLPDAVASGLSAEKAVLRHRFRNLRSSLPEPRREQLNSRICDRFLGTEEYRNADVLLLYASLPEEVDLSRIERHARKDGKQIAFPLCNPEALTLSFRLTESASDLIPGFFGIPEPRPDTRALPLQGIPSDRSVCVVPGIVFDRKGFRIGFGKGYYDRFLPSFPGTRVGLAFDCCVVPSLPAEPFDQAVSLLVTEKGVLTVHEC